MLVDISIQGAGEPRVERRFVSGPLSVGRHGACGLCLADDHVSREHARLHCEPEGLRVADLSSNGTVVGERLLRREDATVPYGTPILLGLHTLRIQPVSPPPEPANLAAEPLAISPAPLAISPAPVTHPEPITHSEPLANPESLAVASASADPALRREIHRRLLEHLDLVALDPRQVDDGQLRPRVLTALRRIIAGLEGRLPRALDTERLIGELADEALGLGPLESLLADASVTEIMVIDPETIYVERAGKLEQSAARFPDDERARAAIERIVTPLGRRIDESTPLVDARLPDGSRVNAIIAPLSLRGACITIRKFSRVPLTLNDLYARGTLTLEMGRFLSRSVVAKRNIVISGGTGSGKTTLLNVLSAAIPEDERIVTIEDAAELRLAQRHVVSLETRPANMEGNGCYTMRDLVKNALRMRPDRIVVGECRGGEALDMLQAMNTGHDGSLTTTHANSPAEALARIEMLASMAGLDVPARAIREQLAASVHLVVQQCRLSDGSRKITEIAELVGIDADGELELHPIYRFTRSGTAPDGRVLGELAPTGRLPSFLSEFRVRGLVSEGEAYL
jgi:pilus assembly protein CpaF